MAAKDKFGRSPADAGSGHSPKGGAASASPAKPSVPNAGKTAFLCKLMGIDFETREVTLRAWNSMPAISSGFYVIVSQAEWTEMRDRAQPTGDLG